MVKFDFPFLSPLNSFEKEGGKRMAGEIAGEIKLGTIFRGSQDFFFRE